RNGCGFLNVEIVELTSYVRPASCFDDSARFVNFVVSGERIGLQDAREVFQMRLRMDAFAIGRVAQPDGGRCRVTTGPIIAGVDPQSGFACLATARSQYLNWGIVGMQLLGGKNMATQGIKHRAK